MFLLLVKKTGKAPILQVDSQSLIITGMKGKSHNSEPLKVLAKETPVYDEQSLSHMLRECKYHIVWILKYCKKSIFGDIRKYLV